MLEEREMAQCSQCSNKAIFQIDGGHLLCLNCYRLFQETITRQNDELARVYNHLIDQMEATVGVPGVLPRISPRAEPTMINTGPMTFNNINVSDSVVGVINTGQVQHLDVAVDAARDAGEEQLASALQALSQAVVDAQDLTPQQKDEAVEHLTFLAEQAATPKDERKGSVGKQVITGLEHIVNAAASVTTFWPVVYPLFLKLF